MQLLDPDEISNGVLSKAVSYVNKLCSDFNLVRSNLVRTKFNKHSINFGTGKLRVKPAKFVRTVMLSPTEKARSVKDIVFADVCVDIPRGGTQWKEPARGGPCYELMSSTNAFQPFPPSGDSTPEVERCP